MTDSAAVELRRGRTLALGPTIAGLASPALAFFVVLTLAFFDGGYWPTAWGWGGVALAWTAMLALVLREAPRLGRLELALVAAFALFVSWVLLSALWSESAGRSVLEGQRAVLFLGGVTALLVLGRTRQYGRIVLGLWAAITPISGYALATKLFPGTFESSNPIAGFRLEVPIGYWNALGAFCGMGALLAIGLAAHDRGRLVRALAAGSVPMLLVTLYFTYSRGAWLSLAIGGVGLALLDTRRLRLAAVATAVAAPAGLALAAAYGSDLAETGISLPAVIDAGRDLGYVIVLACAAAALLGFCIAAAEHRLDPPAWLERGFARLLLVGILGAAVFGLVRAGGPVGLPERIRSAVNAPPVGVPVGESANQRLFSLSSNGRIAHWRVAQDEFAERPLVGTGAGTYELHWLAKRAQPFKVRDAHSLYLETLGELGIVGMGLLGLALAVPLAAALVARRHALVPAATAAYLAYLAHAAVDWDWELPAVTLAALFCGGAVLIAARKDGPALSIPARALGVTAALVVSAFALVGLIGSSALDKGWDALGRGEPARALDEAEVAERWSPWSSDPLRLAAAAVSLDGDDAAARGYLRRAIERDPADWNLWFDLAQVSDPAEERPALAQALRLNPLGPEIAEYLAENEIPRADLPEAP